MLVAERWRFNRGKARLFMVKKFLRDGTWSKVGDLNHLIFATLIDAVLRDLNQLEHGERNRRKLVRLQEVRLFPSPLKVACFYYFKLAGLMKFVSIFASFILF
uniref:Uncharacterized protein n=1 Tax=Arabidopsis halleri subsp. halleri TaxID=81971 RepID=I0J3I7_ARAHH|nr:unknown [Arabidopsis halleri subsp. halleri]